VAGEEDGLSLESRPAAGKEDSLTGGSSMARFSERGAATRTFLYVIVVIVLAIAVVGLWLVMGPGPMDFAAGKRVALTGSAAGGGGSGAGGGTEGGSGAGGPTGVPKELAHASLIERGQYLARAADCVACHTKDGGEPFTGGRPFVLPFGTLYSTNITPDKKTGIGEYTDADFLNAMRKGIAKDGMRLYPAMPYASYTYMTDEDALAIKAYLFSLAPVEATETANTLSFPYNQRWAMGLWSAAFNPNKRFESVADQSAEWNRGAYLAEAMAHCGDCHTPRNVGFALDNHHKFAGAKQAGWVAYNISSDKATGIGEWKPEEIAQYIASGHAAGRGTADGPMGEAVENSLRYLTPGDVSAIATYVASVPAVKSENLPVVKNEAAPKDHKEGVTAAVDPRGKEIYEGACVSCHGWSGESPILGYANLTGSRSVNDPSGTNVVQIVVSGSSRVGVHGGLYMPDFGGAYSDTEIAAVANYVTARFGTTASNLTAANVADLRREDAK
jgi:mono/diheme cytochrome c family protein